jgi:ABC-type nitrate/sulfonate/bicarbonate transport system substrate-binding protein
MHKRMRAIVAAAVGGTCAGWLIGVAAAAQAGQPAGRSEPLQANVAVVVNFNHLPTYVGVEKGIFLKHGLDLKVKQFHTGQDISKAMQVGDAEFAGAAISNVPVAIERGLPAVMVVGLIGDATTPYADSNLAVIARPGAGIEKLEDLSGKKVGIQVGSTVDQYVRLLLTKRKIPQEKVTFINVPETNWLSTLQQGLVDAVTTWEPYGELLLTRIPGARLVWRGGREYGYFIFMHVMDKMVAAKPAVIEAYTAGMAEASQYVRQHQDEAAEVSTRWIPGLDLEVAKKAVRHMAFDPRISKYSIQAFEDSVRILIDQKKMKSPLDMSKVVDARFIEKVQREHPEFFSDLKPVR